jgi:hypothetical protein
MASNTVASRTELIDSLLHTNTKRVVVGTVCGLAAGLVMLLASGFFTPAGMTKTWWLQILGSACFGGDALAQEVPPGVLTSGIITHFVFSAFLGFVFGKVTTSSIMVRNVFYAFVLGVLLWIGSNLFGPNFFNILALNDVGQWSRFFFFEVYCLSLGVLMTVASKALKV